MRKYPITLAILSCLSLACACSSANDNPLAGEWKLVSYADPFKATLGTSSVNSDEPYTLRFQDNGLFSFTTDCNTISGEYIVNKRNLKFENISATELACDKEIVERSIKCELPMVVSFDLPDDSTLCLLGRHDNALATLKRISVHD